MLHLQTSAAQPHRTRTLSMDHCHDQHDHSRTLRKLLMLWRSLRQPRKTRMALLDQSRRQPCLLHTQCMMCSHSTRLCQPSMVHRASMDRRPSQPDQGYKHHSWLTQQRRSDLHYMLTHRCRTVWMGPSHCHESQMDRSCSSTTSRERSNQHRRIHTLCSHPRHRHTPQPHKECTTSRRRRCGGPMST